MDDRREHSTPPNIIIHTPNDGDIVAANSLFQAQVSAAGVTPITRIEMWLNGELNSTEYQEVISEETGGNFQAGFDINLSEGSHMIYWRAVDNRGYVGQTRMITVIAQLDTGAEVSVVIAEEGQTLEDIAEAEEVDFATVGELNPELGEESLPQGTQVNVPKPPSAGDPSKPPPAPEPKGPGQEPKKHPDKPPNTPPLLAVTGTAQVIDIGAFISSILDNMPKAPSGFKAGFENCKIRLTWVDNADNETKFKVWMQRVGGPRQLIGTYPGSPSTGPAWTEFDAPAFGIYGFWVEAVNGLGSQPSEIVGVFVNTECAPDALATSLEIEALDMHITQDVNPVYCYLSIEGAAFRRIPRDANIDVLGGWGDIVKHWGGNKRILIPMPVDNEVSLSGECWGYAGQNSVALGVFNASVPSTQWDGRRLEVSDHGFIVGYRIQPHGETQARGVFQYTDYEILQPHVVDVIKEKAEDPSDLIEDVKLARRPIILWAWDGDESQITSFHILLDGKLLQWAETDWRNTRLLLPAGCGVSYQLQVVANKGDAQSVPSPPFTYHTPPCPMQAEVQFVSIYAENTNDLTCTPFWVKDCFTYSPCSTLDVWGTLWASTPGNYQEIPVGFGGNVAITFPIKCDTEYSFTAIGADEDTLYLPIDPLEPDVRFGTFFKEWDEATHDDWGNTNGFTPKLSLDQWATYDEEFILFAPDPDNTAEGVVVKIRVRGRTFSE